MSNMTEAQVTAKVSKEYNHVTKEVVKAKYAEAKGFSVVYNLALGLADIKEAKKNIKPCIADGKLPVWSRDKKGIQYKEVDSNKSLSEEYRKIFTAAKAIAGNPCILDGESVEVLGKEMNPYALGAYISGALRTIRFWAKVVPTHGFELARAKARKDQLKKEALKESRVQADKAATDKIEKEFPGFAKKLEEYRATARKNKNKTA